MLVGGDSLGRLAVAQEPPAVANQAGLVGIIAAQLTSIGTMVLTAQLNLRNQDPSLQQIRTTQPTLTK